MSNQDAGRAEVIPSLEGAEGAEGVAGNQTGSDGPTSCSARTPTTHHRAPCSDRRRNRRNQVQERAGRERPRQRRVAPDPTLSALPDDAHQGPAGDIEPLLPAYRRLLGRTHAGPAISVYPELYSAADARVRAAHTAHRDDRTNAAC